MAYRTASATSCGFNFGISLIISCEVFKVPMSPESEYVVKSKLYRETHADGHNE